MTARMVGILLVGSYITISQCILLAAEPEKPVLPTPRPLNEPRKLKSELEALAAEREAARNELSFESPLVAERARLRSDILDLIKKLGEKKATSNPPSVTASPLPIATPPSMPMPPAEKPRFLIEDLSTSFDPLRRAQNLYRAGYHFDALKAFFLIAQDNLPREDRAFVSYMSACFLRSQGKTAEASALFREIASSKDDPFLAEFAITQLDIMNKINELTSLREQLRSKTKTK